MAAALAVWAGTEGVVVSRLRQGARRCTLLRAEAGLGMASSMIPRPQEQQAAPSTLTPQGAAALGELQAMTEHQEPLGLEQVNAEMGAAAQAVRRSGPGAQAVMAASPALVAAEAEAVCLTTAPSLTEAQAVAARS